MTMSPAHNPKCNKQLNGKVLTPEDTRKEQWKKKKKKTDAMSLMKGACSITGPLISKLQISADWHRSPIMHPSIVMVEILQGSSHSASLKPYSFTAALSR